MLHMHVKLFFKSIISFSKRKTKNNRDSSHKFVDNWSMLDQSLNPRNELEAMSSENALYFSAHPVSASICWLADQK